MNALYNHDVNLEGTWKQNVRQGLRLRQIAAKQSLDRKTLRCMVRCVRWELTITKEPVVSEADGHLSDNDAFRQRFVVSNRTRNRNTKGRSRVLSRRSGSLQLISFALYWPIHAP